VNGKPGQIRMVQAKKLVVQAVRKQVGYEDAHTEPVESREIPSLEEGR